MLRGILAICASGMLIVLAAGCDQFATVSNYFALEPEQNGHERLVAGSVDQVAIRTQNALVALGYTPTLTRLGEEVKLTATTSRGSKLIVILTSVQEKDKGAQTRAAIEWDGGRDEQTGFLILARLEAGGK